MLENKNVSHPPHAHETKIRHYTNRLGELGWWLIEDAIHLVTFVGEVTVSIIDAVQYPKKIRWREAFYYMEMCGSNALPISSLIAFSMGIILGFQGVVQLQRFGQEHLLSYGVTMFIIIELGPLMIAMIAIGRAGSAFAAEIGTMKVGEEIDAMRTMGFVPARFLVIPKLIAMGTVMPMLTIYGSLMGIFGGMLVGSLLLQMPMTTYLYDSLRVIKGAWIAQGLMKSFVFGIIITVIGCWRGFEASIDAQGVGQAATKAVVSSIFWVIVADTAITIFFTVVFPW